MIKFSYVVIAYNIELYIERCVNSILVDREDDYEIIIINDGSTDNTLEKINGLAKFHKCIKVVSQENKGALEARKIGIRKAKGEYLFLVDGDDWIDISVKKKYYSLIKENKIDIFSFNAFLAYEDGTTKLYENKDDRELDGKSYKELILTDTINHNVWNKIIRRDFIPMDELDTLPAITMGDDFAFLGLLSNKNPKIHFVNEPYYFYFVRNSSVTKGSSEKLLEIINVLDYLDTYVIDEGNEEISNYLWFKYSYYLRVISARYSRSQIERKFYDLWKEKNINISKNKYCIKYLKNQSPINKLLYKLYNINYLIGTLGINVLLILRRIKG